MKRCFVHSDATSGEIHSSQTPRVGKPMNGGPTTRSRQGSKTPVRRKSPRMKIGKVIWGQNQGKCTPERSSDRRRSYRCSDLIFPIPDQSDALFSACAGSRVPLAHSPRFCPANSLPFARRNRPPLTSSFTCGRLRTADVVFCTPPTMRPHRRSPGLPGAGAPIGKA